MAEHRPTMRQHDSLFLSTGPVNETSTRSGTMVSGDYAFNPEQQQQKQQQHMSYGDQPPQHHYDSRTGTLLDSQAYFSDFAGQSYDPAATGEYGGPQR
jgi:hypothetical protein